MTRLTYKVTDVRRRCIWRGLLRLLPVAITWEDVLQGGQRKSAADRGHLCKVVGRHFLTYMENKQVIIIHMKHAYCYSRFVLQLVQYGGLK